MIKMKLTEPLFLVVLVCLFSTITSNDVCRRDKCSSPDCETGNDCSAIVPVGASTEGYAFVERFTCFDDYVGRAYENMGPILHRFTCCPPDFEGNPLSGDIFFDTEGMCAPWGVYNNACDDHKCSSTFQADCWIVTEYGKFYYGTLEADEMQCTDGYKPVLLEDQFKLYTCCPPDYDGPVTVNFMAMPTVRRHTIICAILTCLNIVAFTVAAVFVFAILSSPVTRSEGFNLYMVMLIVPDMLVNLSSAVYTGYRTHSYDETLIPGWLYKMNFWLLFFYFVCNFWLNAIVAFEIHNLMLRSHRRMRTVAPDAKKVLLQSMITYFLSGLVATWYVINVPWSPYSVNVLDRWNYHGSPTNEKIIAVDQDISASAVFKKEASLAIWFCIILVPAVYVIYVRIDTWWKKLLPVSGRTRAVSLYFLRILFVFFGFYFPGVIIREVFLDWYGIKKAEGGLRFYLWYAANFLLIMQSLVTLYLAMSKPDISLRLSNFTRSLKSLKSSTTATLKPSENVVSPDAVLEQTTNATMSATDRFESNANNFISEWEQGDVYADDESNASEDGKDHENSNDSEKDASP